MTTLYLDRRDVELRHEGTALALYCAGVRQRSVPLKLLERVVMRNRVHLDSSLLGALADAGVGVLVLSGRQGRQLAMLLGAPHNDARIRLAQYALWHDSGLRLAWARRLLAGKINAQHRQLGRWLSARPDRRLILTRAQQQLEEANERLARAGNLPALLGVEGSAAAAYFRGYSVVFAESWHFTGRNRRPPRDPVNAVLSLGYTLLHFDAVRAAHAAGLDPWIGFFHEPAFGRASLATDLVEPLRAHVDHWVWEQFRDRRFRPEHFRQDQGACLLDKNGRATFYAAYEMAARPMRRLLRHLCRDMVRRLQP